MTRHLSRTVITVLIVGLFLTVPLALYAAPIDDQVRVDPVSKTVPIADSSTRAVEFIAGSSVPVPSVEWQLDRDLLLDGGYYLVQFQTLPDASDRAALTAVHGLSFIEYQNDGIWLVSVPAGSLASLEADPGVGFLSVYEPAWKVAPEVLAESGSVSISVRFMTSAAAPVTLEDVASLGFAVESAELRLDPVTRGTVDSALLPAIAGLEEVRWIDLATEPQTDMDVISSGAMHGIDIPQLGGFTGSTILGQVQDAGVEMTHPDLTRVLWTDGTVVSNFHGTATTGIVMATGANDAQAEGILPDLNGAYSMYDVGIQTSGTNLWNGQFNEGNAGMNGLFQSNSWGYGTMDGAYGTETADIDTIAWNFPNQLTLWSAGNANEGTAEGVIRRTGMAKAAICVGGYTHYDDGDRSNEAYINGGNGGSPSRGPAADGRQKPDLAGPFDMIYTTDLGAGYRDDFGGTSGATPSVAGVAGLVYEMYISDFFGQNPTNAYPRSSTVKAMLIADAHQYPLTQNLMTRTVQGWGSPDVENTYDLGADYHVIEEPAGLDSGDSWSRSVTVDGTYPLKVTLAWTEPPSGAATGTARASFNNLDLHVTSPSGIHYYGNNGLLDSLWSTSGTGANDWQSGTPTYSDGLNTIENVFVQSPEAGAWTIEVSGRSGDVASGPQVFSLVASGAQDIGSAGTIDLDQTAYAVEDTVTIAVADLDLNQNPSLIENVFVDVVSDSDPTGESVELTETGSDTAVFQGSISISASPGPGTVVVTGGDTLTATYDDADDGTGSPATAQDTASIIGTPFPAGLVSVHQYGPDLEWVTADQDIPVDGTVTNDYTWTYTSNDQYESIREESILSGPIGNRYNYLEHRWRVPITGSDPIIVQIEAYQSADSDGDNFVFAWSDDDSSYADMFTVTKTADDDAYQEFTLPGGASGPIYIRVRDTVRTPGSNAQQGTVYIDRLEVRTTLGSGATTIHNTLNWTLSADDGAGEDDIVAYDIYRSALSTGPWDAGTLIDSVGPGTWTYVDYDHGTADATLWWYIVRARDATFDDGNTASVRETGGVPDTWPPQFTLVSTLPVPAVSTFNGPLYVEFTSNESLMADPAVTVGGYAMAITSQAGLTYTYEYTPTGAEGSGSKQILVSGADMSGNPRTDQDIGSAIFDFVVDDPDAGPDQAGDIRFDVTFDGSGSSDISGIANYTWTVWDSVPEVLYGVSPSHTFDDKGVYLVELVVTDGTGNTGNAALNVTTQGFHVPVPMTGLVLVSLPTQVSGDPQTVLADTGGDGLTTWDVVWAYLPGSGWRSFVTTRPAYMSDLATVDSTLGLWLNVTSLGDSLLTIGGADPVPVSQPLMAGWNLVGFPSLTTGETVASALSGVTYATVAGFDSVWPYRTRDLGGADGMSPGGAYWVKCPAADMWMVP